jgi:hypothetical protein
MATLSQTGHLFDHLALCFMTSGGLHDRRVRLDNSERSKLAIFQCCSVGLRSGDVTAALLIRDVGIRDREGSLSW